MNKIEIKDLIRAKKLVRINKFISISGIIATLCFVVLPLFFSINYPILNAILGGIVLGSLGSYHQSIVVTNQMINLLEKQINSDPVALKEMQSMIK